MHTDITRTLNITSDSIMEFPYEIQGLQAFRQIVPYAFRHENIKIGNEAIDGALFKMLIGINCEEEIAKLTGLKLRKDPPVCILSVWYQQPT